MTPEMYEMMVVCVMAASGMEREDAERQLSRHGVKKPEVDVLPK